MNGPRIRPALVGLALFVTGGVLCGTLGLAPILAKNAALAFEALGSPAAALSLWELVSAMDPADRDASKKIAQLKAQTAPTPAATP